MNDLTNLYISLGELLGVVSLVDDLSHSDDVTLVVAYGHAQDQLRLVAGPPVYIAAEPGVLQQH